MLVSNEPSGAVLDAIAHSVRDQISGRALHRTRQKKPGSRTSAMTLWGIRARSPHSMADSSRLPRSRAV